MSNLGRLVLGTSSIFMILMAVMLNSPELFYMSTALVALLLASRLQAWLSVRGLKFERIAPPAAKVGEDVIIGLIVWSEKRLKRPLVLISDELPPELVYRDMTPSLPVAPAYDQPIFSQYRFVPLRRGKFKWSKVHVEGTDALGLVSVNKSFETEPAHLTVYPAPIPVSLTLNPVPGYGSSEMETGRQRGSGIEPRGIREYAEGDPEKNVHWRSSARAGKLMVKEFETGSGLNIAFFPQRSRGSEIGDEATTTLEAMCGHAAYLSDQFLRMGARVLFPTLEQKDDHVWAQDVRMQEILELLTDITASGQIAISAEVDAACRRLAAGSTLYVMIAAQDPALPSVLAAHPNMTRFCLIYDASAYSSRLPSGVRTAAEPSYLAQLQAAGADLQIMPLVEGVG